MKFIALLLISTMTLPLFAATNTVPNDQELARALGNLEGRVEITAREYLHQERSMGLRIALAGVGIKLFAYVPPVMKNISQVGSIVTFVGGAIWAVNHLKVIAERSKKFDPRHADTEENLKYFFAMPIDEQFSVARQNPALARLVVKLSDAYEYIQTARPEVEAGELPTIQ